MVVSFLQMSARREKEDRHLEASSRSDCSFTEVFMIATLLQIGLIQLIMWSIQFKHLSKINKCFQLIYTCINIYDLINELMTLSSVHYNNKIFNILRSTNAFKYIYINNQ